MLSQVIFGGFSAQAIADRLDDAQAEFIITCDGAFRGAKDIPLKSVIDDALVGNKTIKKVIVCTRTRTPVSMIKGRDVWWEDEIKKVETLGNPDCPAVEMNAEDILFILYLVFDNRLILVFFCAASQAYVIFSFFNLFIFLKRLSIFPVLPFVQHLLIFIFP